MRQDAAEDFLPAELEHSPASVEPYVSLGDYYMDLGDSRKAIEQYQYALELSPADVAIHDKLALAYYKSRNRADAVAQWKLFFAAQLNQVNNSRLTDTFWTDFGRACDHVRTRGLFGEVKPEIEQAGSRLPPSQRELSFQRVVAERLRAARQPLGGDDVVARSFPRRPDPTSRSSGHGRNTWIPIANRGPLYQRILDAVQTAGTQEGRTGAGKCEGYVVDAGSFAG